MAKDQFSRRTFLSHGAIALSGAALTLSGFEALAQPVSQADVIRLGIIGTGSRGAGLASLVKELPGIKLLAWCDIQEKNLDNGMSIAGKGAKSYTDYRKLLDDKNIDAVIIATPHYLHYPMAVDALAAGKHIYLEKSMTYDIPQSLDLLTKVRNKPDQVFQVGFQYRYYALYHKVKEVISKKWIGDVTHFESQYNRNSNWRLPVPDPGMERAINWRMYREYCGGPLTELCAHQIDAINYITGSHPEKVIGMGGINYWKDGRDTYDNIRVIYEYPGGVKSSVTSVLSNAYNGYNIRILGDKGTIEIQRDKAFIYAESVNNAKGTVDGVTGATIAAKTQGEGVELIFEKPGEANTEPTITSLTDFIACIQNKRQAISNAETAHITSVSLHIGNKAMDTEKEQLWKPEFSI